MAAISPVFETAHNGTPHSSRAYYAGATPPHHPAGQGEPRRGDPNNSPGREPRDPNPHHHLLSPDRATQSTPATPPAPWGPPMHHGQSWPPLQRGQKLPKAAKRGQGWQAWPTAAPAPDAGVPGLGVPDVGARQCGARRGASSQLAESRLFSTHAPPAAPDRIGQAFPACSWQPAVFRFPVHGSTKGKRQTRFPRGKHEPNGREQRQTQFGWAKDEPNSSGAKQSQSPEAKTNPIPPRLIGVGPGFTAHESQQTQSRRDKDEPNAYGAETNRHGHKPRITDHESRNHSWLLGC